MSASAGFQPVEKRDLEQGLVRDVSLELELARTHNLLELSADGVIESERRLELCLLYTSPSPRD